MLQIWVSKLTLIGSDNGLAPGRRQAIIWTNAWIELLEPLGTNFSEILIKILIFSFEKICLKVSSAKWRPFCLGLNVLISNFQFHALIYYLDFRWLVSWKVYVDLSRPNLKKWRSKYRHQWLNTKLWYIFGISNGDTAVPPEAINAISLG